MSVSFRDPLTGQAIRSTEFARRVLAKAASTTSPSLSDDISGAPDWRNWYLRLYSDLAIEEGKSLENTLKIATAGLAEFQSCLFSKQSVLEEASSGWSEESELVETIVIRGSGVSEKVKIERHSGSLEEIARLWVANSLAEPGLIDAYKFLDQNPNLPIQNDLLFAVAGAAEFAPTEQWLRWGGKVAVVARPNQENWSRLLSLVIKTSGTLLVPVRKDRVAALTSENLSEMAGLDILEDIREIAWWAKSMVDYRKLILGLYAYSPGTSHIQVQAVQDALAEVATSRLTPDTLVLSWLATPTDSAPAPEAVAKAAISRFQTRKPLTILRDSLLGLLNWARAPRPRFFEGDREPMALIDASVQQQGPSYSFSKRTQRWRAYLASSQGFKVSYAIAPPAKTDSVLSHRILRASYRGSPHFGVVPFEVDTAKSAIAAVLLRDVFDEGSLELSAYSLHALSAIHGGLWRLPYHPKSVWLAATVIGLPALLRKGY